MHARIVLLCAAFVIALVGVTVGIDRVMASVVYADPSGLVPTYRSYPDEIMSRKLQTLEASDRRFDTVMIGNSRALYGIDPLVFDQRMRAQGSASSSYNLAALTVDARFWRPFFDDVVPERRPRQVLYGIAPRDIDERNVTAADYLRRFRSSPGFESRSDPKIERTAEELLAALYTMRGRINDLKRARPGDRIVRPNSEPVNQRGWPEFPPERTEPPAQLVREAARDAARRGRSQVLRPGADQMGELRGLARTVRERGGCLTLFTVPVLYDEELWGTPAIRRAFVAQMRRFERTMPGVRFVDLGAQLRARYGAADFADGDHLRRSGAERFSSDLADAVAAGPPCPR